MQENDDQQLDTSAANTSNRRFVLWAGGLLVAAVLVFAAVTQLPIFGRGFHAVFAVILGVGFTIALAVGLMALTFYSARSGHDDQIGE